jgi:Fe2+ transport system protein FeoA
VGLFRRRKPLHERLADAGGITDGSTEPVPSLAADAPGWDGEQRGEPGIHGVPRARRWDTVASAEAPAIKGDTVHFVALTDGTLVVDEDEPDGALTSLAEAVEQAIPPPYRAEAVRKGPETWAVAASRIAIAQVPGLTGDQAELTSTREGRVLRIDGRTTMGSVRELERLGETEGTEYVVLAKRLDGDLWEVEATAL